MFDKIERTKVFRDPLYGYITVDYKIISDLIDTKELQRMRRIRQLSGVSMVFQTAEHSRFTHSLGCYQMANLVLQNVEGMEALDEYQKVIFLCAALLHDIGHGPYSHAFEHVIETSHEDMSVALILSEQTEVNQVLKQHNVNPLDIANVIAHNGAYPLIESLVSSQLDVDRMDYLSRDAYFTGAAYGHIDYFRILRSMKVVHNQLLVRSSGVHSIESYLMSRYHMYFQVYYHPVARAYECILEAIYLRIKDMIEQNLEVDASIDSFLRVLKNNQDIEAYVDLDDAYVNGFIKQLTKSKDEVLNQLSNAFQNRHLFHWVDLADEPTEEELLQIKNKYTEQNKRYYYKEANVSGVAYLHSKKSDMNDIKVLLPNGDVKSLEKYSPIIKSLTLSSYKLVERIYYFEDENGHNSSRRDS